MKSKSPDEPVNEAREKQKHLSEQKTSNRMERKHTRVFGTYIKLVQR